MPLYNLSQFMTKVKQDIKIADIPVPFTDHEIVERFRTSGLVEFSVRSPFITNFGLSSADIIDNSQVSVTGAVTYRIPKHVYQDTPITQVLSIDVGRSGGFSDYYMPTAGFHSPEFILETIADIKMAAAMGSMMQHAPTFRFTAPDMLTIYNGWCAGTYLCEAGLVHDISLATVPPTAFTHLFQVAELDLEWFFYDEMCRKDEIDTGYGSFKLLTQQWEGSEDKLKDLLKEWDEQANLDVDRINYW